MDEAGIDVQVLSLNDPGCQLFDASEATALAKSTNDELARVIKKYPDRFIGLAAIAPQAPKEAADELERAVKDLGLSGGYIGSNVKGEYLDDPKYWVIFEKAEKLAVPIYPFESNKEAVQFMDSASVSEGDRETIYPLNAEKLLAL